MKLLSIILIVTLLASPSYSAFRFPAKALEQAATQQETSIRVVTKGVVCAFCAQGLKNTFGENPAIKKVRFDEEFNYMELVLNDGAEISDEEISQGVEDSGYEVEEIIR